MIRAFLLTLACAGVLLPLPARAGGTASPVWSGYLDLAYVYSSAEPDALKARLDGYAEEAGVSLQRYIEEYFETLAPLEAEDDESATRRKAIAYLLDYLARGEPASLSASVATIAELGERLERQENRYWYRYILAHRALEKGYSAEFVDHVLDLWLEVVVPLEAPYETLDTLSLSDSPNSGFVSALPYIYENLTRLVLIRSQQAGLARDLDPLGAIARLLADGRVGMHPDVVPAEASSRAYLDRIVERLDGPESDDGSLTFTLALFQASQHHDQALNLLASEDLSPATLRAMRRASGAYETAQDRAHTIQGHCAVYTRVLRMLGQLYAARQRLGVDPELDMPFSIEGAVEVYAELRGGLDGNAWRGLGYRTTPRATYVEAMRGLWEEIQETSLNAADYYLTRAVESPQLADHHSRNAARVYTRYLSFFHRFATENGKEATPDSAYFAAFEAARGVGDAYLAYAAHPTQAEIDLASQRYRSALTLFPFDRELWPALTAALSRHGREGEYAALVRPIAEQVARSHAVSSWIDDEEPEAQRIAALRRALSESLVIMYMGFADASGLAVLHEELEDLRVRRETKRIELDELTALRDALRTGAEPAPREELPAAADDSAIALDDAAPSLSSLGLGLAEVARRLADNEELLTRLDQQVAARSRALPLYVQTLETDGFTGELRAQRDHPVHTLLRRMYHERRAADDVAQRRGDS